MLGPHYATLDVTLQDFRLAQEFGLIASMHQGGGPARNPEGWARLEAEGLLNRLVNIVHGNDLSDAQLERFVACGVRFTVTPESEMISGHGHPILGRLRDLGAAPSLGADIECGHSSDMLAVGAHGAEPSARARQSGRARATGPSAARRACGRATHSSWVTLEGARMLGQEDRIGSIAPGKQADLVLLRADALNLQPIHDPISSVVMQSQSGQHRFRDDRRRMAQARRHACCGRPRRADRRARRVRPQDQPRRRPATCRPPLSPKRRALKMADNVTPDANASAAQQAALLDPSRAILIRQAHLITMDDGLGDLVGDVLVKDGKIAAVGRDLACDDAVVIDGTDKVVIPGFVNSHIHLWQTVIKGCAGDYSFGDYLKYILGEAGKHYQPEDVRVSTLLGALEQLDAGVTTLYDWAHILNTPDHADRGDRRACRPRACAPCSATARPATTSAAGGTRAASGIRRTSCACASTRLASDDALVTLGLSLRGPDFAVEDVNTADIQLARSLGIMASMHCS